MFFWCICFHAVHNISEAAISRAQKKLLLCPSTEFYKYIREGCGKSKGKFKRAFAMKGGGGLEGVSFAIKLF